MLYVAALDWIVSPPITFGRSPFSVRLEAELAQRLRGLSLPRLKPSILASTPQHVAVTDKPRGCQSPRSRHIPGAHRSCRQSRKFVSRRDFIVGFLRNSWHHHQLSALPDELDRAYGHQAMLRVSVELMLDKTRGATNRHTATDRREMSVGRARGLVQISTWQRTRGDESVAISPGAPIPAAGDYGDDERTTAPAAAAIDPPTLQGG